MRKIDKFLLKLRRDVRLKILATLEQIQAGDFSGLDMKKLKGASDQYRVRVGRIRIKFVMNTSGTAVYDIDFRNDTTY